MTAITASMIKELRDRTGIGMGKCKEALQESGGDIEVAISNLRKAGMASAVKKEGRETNEGMVAFAETDSCIGLVEVAAETDFVVQNEKFQEFVADMAAEVAASAPESLEAFLAAKNSKDGSLTNDELRANLVQAIGENIQVKRVLALPKTGEKSYGVYSHLGGKIVVVVEVEGSADEAEVARNIAMHAAASAPQYLNPESVPEDVITNEKEIAKAQMKGKPENIIEKILEGKMNSFFDDVCLTRQKYIRDDSQTIEQIVTARAKESGKPLVLTAFTRWSK